MRQGMLTIEHVAGGWEYRFGNNVAEGVDKILIFHNGDILITYLDGREKKVPDG